MQKIVGKKTKISKLFHDDKILKFKVFLHQPQTQKLHQNLFESPLVSSKKNFCSLLSYDLRQHLDIETTTFNPEYVIGDGRKRIKV